MKQVNVILTEEKSLKRFLSSKTLIQKWLSYLTLIFFAILISLALFSTQKINILDIQFWGYNFVWKIFVIFLLIIIGKFTLKMIVMTDKTYFTFGLSLPSLFGYAIYLYLRTVTFNIDLYAWGDLTDIFQYIFVMVLVIVGNKILLTIFEWKASPILARKNIFEFIGISLISLFLFIIEKDDVFEFNNYSNLAINDVIINIISRKAFYLSTPLLILGIVSLIYGVIKYNWYSSKFLSKRNIKMSYSLFYLIPVTIWFIWTYIRWENDIFTYIFIIFEIVGTLALLYLLFFAKSHYASSKVFINVAITLIGSYWLLWFLITSFYNGNDSEIYYLSITLIGTLITSILIFIKNPIMYKFNKTLYLWMSQTIFIGTILISFGIEIDLLLPMIDVNVVEMIKILLLPLPLILQSIIFITTLMNRDRISKKEKQKIKKREVINA